MDSNNLNRGRVDQVIKKDLEPTFIEPHIPTKRSAQEIRSDLPITFVPDPPRRGCSTESAAPIAYVAPTHSQLQSLASDTLVEMLTTIHAILNDRDEV